jgi:hypothetical protein
MLALLSALLLFANADLTSIYENGAFSKTVGLHEPGFEAGSRTMRVYFNPPRCLNSFVVTVSEETQATVQTVVGHKDGRYIWGTIGKATLTPENGAIAIEDAPHCVSRFRINVEQPVIQGN